MIRRALFIAALVAIPTSFLGFHEYIATRAAWRSAILWFVLAALGIIFSYFSRFDERRE